jgi:hypothetical protein
MLQLIAGTFVSQAVSVAARLGVADVLSEDPRNVDEIAADVHAHPQTLYRLLRALADVGVFAELPGRRFASTRLSALLRTEAPGSLRGLATMVGLPFHRNAWTDLYTSVRTGEPAFARVHGTDLFTYLHSHSDDAAVFDAAMTGVATQILAGFLTDYDFTPFRTVVDVGAGSGGLLAAVLTRQPVLRGTLFDQPAVVSSALPVLTAAGVADRCEIMSGDFFVSVPPGGDLYILSNIIHDWDDQLATQILRNVRAAMRPDARVLLVEGVLPDSSEPSAAKLFDLEMLALTPGGRQRTEDEYARLLASAGFSVTTSVAARPGERASYVEAVPLD